MQTIIYNSFANGYFELYRGGADIINNEIVGKDKYNRFYISDYVTKARVYPFYLTPRIYQDQYNSTECKNAMLKFLNIDCNEVAERKKTGQTFYIKREGNYKICFTTNGEIVLYDSNKTKDPIRKSKIVKTNCKWFKEWGKSYSYYQLKEQNPGGFEVKGWKFPVGAEYIKCTSFHFITDLRLHLIPERFKGDFLELAIKAAYNHEAWLEINELLYQMNPIDLNECWDWTDEEKEEIRKAEEEKIRKEQEAREELERRKNTPGYCSLCGADHAEWIPFEGMWLCKDCYYDMKGY